MPSEYYRILTQRDNASGRTLIGETDEEAFANLFYEDYLKALSDLSADEREVMMHSYNCMGNKEDSAISISRTMNIPKSKVYRLKKSAISKLRENEVLSSYNTCK